MKERSNAEKETCLVYAIFGLTLNSPKGFLDLELVGNTKKESGYVDFADNFVNSEQKDKEVGGSQMLYLL
jgi:hypothetical protein